MDFKSTSFFNSLSNLLQPIQQKMDQLLSKFPGEDEQTKRARYEKSVLNGLSNSIVSMRTAISGIRSKSLEGLNKLSNEVLSDSKKLLESLNTFPAVDSKKNYKDEVDSLWHLVRALENSFYKLKKELLSQF